MAIDAAAMKQARPLLGPIRVTVPARVAFNHDLLKKSIAALAESLGCGRCFSGADCRLELERNWLIDPADKAAPTMRVAPSPAPSFGGSAPVLAIGVAPNVSYDIDRLMTAIDSVYQLLGCMPCHSGFDIELRNQVILVDEKAGAHRFTGAM